MLIWQKKFNTLKHLAMLFVFSLLSACANLTESFVEIESEPTPLIVTSQQQNSEGTLHFHVERLARQLLDTANGFDVSRPVIVGTFLPADSYSNNDNAALVPYGIQIQESFATFAAQAGLKVIEFKTLPAVKISEHADVMMSRSTSDLDASVTADYMLTGSYTQLESSLMVNVRLIRVFDKTIVAAATDYLPLNSMWSHNKVQIKNNQLYRGEY